MSVSELSDAEEEQRTENPCVPGSIPGDTTLKKSKIMKPVEMLNFNGFSFYVYLAENGKFVSLDISHSVVFPESH